MLTPRPAPRRQPRRTATIIAAFYAWASPMSSPRRVVLIVLAGCGLWCFAANVLAGAAAHLDPVDVVTYPNRAIRVVVPWPPEGGADLLTRTLVEPLRVSLRQRISVDNRAGDNGNVGAALVANSPPDGYTLLVCAGDTLVINPVLYGAKTPFRGLDDFEPVALLAYSDLALAVHPSLRAHSIADLIAGAKSGSRSVRVATSGSASRGHLLSLILERREAVDLRLVPYPGAAAAAKAAAGGETDAVFASYSSMAAFVTANKLRMLAVTARRGEVLAPDLAQAFFRFELELYYGLFVPRNTPREIVERINLHVNRAFEKAPLQERLAALGFDLEPDSAAAFARRMQVDRVRWARALVGFPTSR
jgi:tripartite-type tricarboxylate transporter receptor subunit TctC